MSKDKLDNIKSELDKYIADYLSHLNHKSQSIDETLEYLKVEEESLRETQDNLNNMYETIIKLMELKVNANILRQHFLGCLKVAGECEDEMCAKIFVNQAFSTLTQTDQFLQAQLGEKFEVMKFDELLKVVEQEENYEKTLIQSQNYIDTLEKIMKQLNELVSELPPAQY